MRTMPAPRARGLVDELLRSHRFTMAALGLILLLSTLSSGYLIVFSQPRLSNDIDMTRSTREAHAAMLDQETGLRGWLPTGKRDFLAPYLSGLVDKKKAFDDLNDNVKKAPELTAGVIKLELASERWQMWAAQASQRNYRGRPEPQLEAFLQQGRALFDSYRTVYDRNIAALTLRRASDLEQQKVAMVLSFLIVLAVLLVTALVSVRRRRELRHDVLRPVENLLETITALHAGDLSRRTDPTTVPELHQIGTELDRLAVALSAARDESSGREARLQLMAQRFETVVRVGREISGSLSVRYVAGSVTTAAAELLSASAILWVRGEDQSFHVVHRSQDPHGATPPIHLVAPTLVLQTAAEARPVAGDSGRAYPLVLAGMVTGVLEVPFAVTDSDTDQVIDALLSTAAAALESAHLHSSARELADMDGLTQLPNRRRFEVDIDTEWDRCRRYGRPMSVVMIDLDHFKQLNDRHGHLVGDQVLRQVASALGATLRTTDTAYRYGGEELVVLLRETGLEDAAGCAERMRLAVAEVSLLQHAQVTVSCSAGVGTRHAGMAHHSELVAQADAALYEAKRTGRDRVVTAGLGSLPGPEVLFAGSVDQDPGPLFTS